jgi:cell pole-organizing protein PopZ
MAQTNTVQREPSMEEILASIRKIIEESDGARTLPTQPESPVADASMETVRPGLSEVEAFHADLVRRREPEEAPFVDLPPVPATPLGTEGETPSSHEVAEPVFSIDDAELAAELSKPADAGELAAVPPSSETRQGIVSHHTRQQVAHSFGELSEAFLASRRKSFDEMAEEMLRPMLQDWLDNNLPVLVERLVREEIERVARGVAG